MTEEDKESLIATNQENAASDICYFVEDLILHRQLNENEKRNLSIKVKYWFLIGAQRERLIITEQFKSMAKSAGVYHLTGMP